MLREGGSDVKVMTTLHGTDITIVGQESSFYAITKFSIEKSCPDGEQSTHPPTRSTAWRYTGLEVRLFSASKLI